MPGWVGRFRGEAAASVLPGVAPQTPQSRWVRELSRKRTWRRQSGRFARLPCRPHRSQTLGRMTILPDSWRSKTLRRQRFSSAMQSRCVETSRCLAGGAASAHMEPRTDGPPVRPGRTTATALGRLLEFGFVRPKQSQPPDNPSLRVSPAARDFGRERADRAAGGAALVICR